MPQLKSEPFLQQAPASKFSAADFSILKQQAAALRSALEQVRSLLAAVKNAPASGQVQGRLGVHDSVARLQTCLSEFQQQTSVLVSRNAARADWIAINNLTSADFARIQAVSEDVRQSASALMSAEQPSIDELQAELRSQRSDIEAKFKATETGGQSDYQILISIVKAINEELGIFNKSLL